MCAMSSGAGAGNAVLGWAVDAGIVDVDDQQVAPVEPVGQPGGGDRGDRRGIVGHELDPGRRVRRVDRQIRRTGLEHRQDRHDRLGRPRRTAAPHTVPGPHPGRPAGAPTGWRPRRARGTSSTGRRRSAPPPPECVPPERRTTPKSTPASSAGSTPPGCRPHPAGRARRRRADPPTTTGASGSAVIATNTRVNRWISFSMLPASNTSVSNSRRRLSSCARHGLQRQRVVVAFAGGELGDGQPVGAQHRTGVDRVVLVDEQGVEQLVVAGDAVDLVERQVLVVECVRCGRFAVGRAGRRWWCPR